MSGRSGTATCALSANGSTRKRGRRLPYYVLLSAILIGATILVKDRGAGLPATPPRSKAQWARLYGALPLSFQANRGQTDSSVNFVSHGGGFTLFLTGREAVLSLRESSPTKPGQNAGTPDSVLRLQLAGANPHALATGRDELPGKANYFIGNDPGKWHTDIPTYARVKYEGIYPGVDLVYYGTQGGELEYDFVVTPGADPQAIALGVQGLTSAPLRINAEGELIVPLAGGDVRLHKPVVYQESGIRSPESGVTSGNPKSAIENRKSIEGRYVLEAENRVRFELGPYDRTRPLVIDPVLTYATYLGGSGGDTGFAIAVDSSFDAYVAGITNSTNFPTGGSPLQSTSRGAGDCFVTKINSAGTQLLYSTYLGGSGTDQATALAYSAGNIFLTGSTTSVDFPTVSPVAGTNPFQMNYGGNTDAFVTQINSTGSIIVYSSYLGGSGVDTGQGIAVDSTGNAYVTGFTESANFPLVDSYQSANRSADAFVTKVNFNGTGLIYSTYLGGSAADYGQAITLDSSGNAYVAGYTYSPDFPNPGALQPTLAGSTNAFVSELSFSGTALSLVFSTYLGGSADDRAFGIALDGSNNIYVTGYASSTNFPVTSGSFQTTLKGASNAFVTKLSAGGTAIAYSTYLGGSGVDKGTAIAVGQSGSTAGNAFVTGSTQSSDFPASSYNPIQAVLGLSNSIYCGTLPCPDAFVTQLNAAGTNLVYSTYLGGNNADFGQAIALDSTGDPYITGSTISPNFPAASAPMYNTTYVPPYKSTLTGTAGNAFIAKIDAGNNPNISLVPASLNFGNETIGIPSAVQQINVTNPSTAPLVITSIALTSVPTPEFTESDNCVGTVLPYGSTCLISIIFTPTATGSQSTQITITDNAGGTAGITQVLNVTGNGVTAATAVTVQPTSLSFSSQNVASVSPPQSVSITNTGTQTLNITQISTGTSGDYSQTNTCAPTYSLAVGQSCSVSVTFSPTASGTRTGALSISDNAAGSPQTVSLTGIGNAEFSLTSPTAGNPVIIGATTTTYTIVANGPSTFNGAISLACSAGTTCTFTANPIFVGNNTTMTVNNLTTTMPNPYPFTLTGTSGSQTYTLQLSLGFMDYSMSSTPSIRAIAAGTPASYNIIINPLNGFNNQVVNLICYTGLPQNATCSFNNATPNISSSGPTTVSLTINTAKYVTTTNSPPRFPGGPLPPLLLGILTLAGLASLALGSNRRARRGWLGTTWLAVRLATLSAILVCDLALVGCRSSQLNSTGTVPGNYTVTVQGILASNTVVVRNTTLNLSVTASP